MPVGVTVDEINVNLKRGSLRGVLRLQTNQEGVKKDSESMVPEFEVSIRSPQNWRLHFQDHSFRTLSGHKDRRFV